VKSEGMTEEEIEKTFEKLEKESETNKKKKRKKPDSSGIQDIPTQNIGFIFFPFFFPLLLFF
jgi:hypothetical protein